MVIPPSEGFHSQGFPSNGNLEHAFLVPQEATIMVDMRCLEIIEDGVVVESNHPYTNHVNDSEF